jgi:hypothetical protein
MAIDNAVIGLVGVVIGAGISTGVTYLLAIRREKTEQGNWRRDRALEAYSEFMRLVDAITLEANGAYYAKGESDEYKKHGPMVVANLAELYRANDRVLLLASEELRLPFTALCRHVTGEFVTKAVECPKVPEVEFKEARTKLADLSWTFTVTARNDLGVNRIRTRSWRRFWRWGRS